MDESNKEKCGLSRLQLIMYQFHQEVINTMLYLKAGIFYRGRMILNKTREPPYQSIYLSDSTLIKATDCQEMCLKTVKISL